ncbi:MULTISPECIES: immunity protein YezG family protein [unclassified Pseudoalteromonas]|uniref:immunity protein YezG family protein n=1 Tax=Pseudoalteromonas sp. RB2-MNA-CIBAN-0110 TaxID=3140439 RepID=UPI00040C2819|nr:immunity protein YezG family protein [Pseudoalteromonas sp. TB13]
MQPDIKNIPQHLGQYLYQQIDEPWLEAQLILDCENNAVITCKAHFIKVDDETQHEVAVSDAITALFKTLFDHAIKNETENWQRAIFTITRQGQFNLNFERDNSDEATLLL